MYKNRIIVGVEGEEENTGDEKGFSTFLWCVYYFCGPLPLFLFSFSHHFGWCGFLGGRKLDEKENWEVGDNDIKLY